MNILIIGTPLILEPVLKSKLIEKIYTAGFEPTEKIPNIEFEGFEDLAQKAISLRIDIAITADKNLIQAGIADILKKYKINIIAVNQKWFNLETNKLAAKQLMDFYSIKNPPIIKAPLAFPIVIKSNETTKIAKKMQELVTYRENLSGQQVFLEEFLNGETATVLFLWDRKNLLAFPPKNFTEVQEDRFELLKTKLNFMLSDEQANFTGFFSVKLIWANNDWYVLDYIMRLTEKSALNNIKTDFLYLLNAAIYQKLHEL